MPATKAEHAPELYPSSVDYYDPTYTACDSAATAFLMQYIGAPRELWTPGSIDKISGRSPGEPTLGKMVFRNLLALLEQGAEMKEITPFDPNEFLKQGLVYVEQHHKDDWVKEDPEDFYSHWAESLADFTEATASFEERVNTEFRHSFSRLKRLPNTEDLRGLVSNGNAVKVYQTSTIAASLAHMVVVTGIEPPGKGSYITKFDPDLAHQAQLEGPIIEWPFSDFYGRWMRSEGIIGVKKYSSSN